MVPVLLPFILFFSLALYKSIFCANSMEKSEKNENVRNLSKLQVKKKLDSVAIKKVESH
jgi:hypothetical protein